jgi:hypothetical protein
MGSGGIFSVALSVGSRLPGVTWHPALWSPDFPPSRFAAETRLPGRLSRLLSTTRKRIDSVYAAGLTPASIQQAVDFPAWHVVELRGHPCRL